MTTGIPRPRTGSFSLHISMSASNVTAISSSSSSSTSSSPSGTLGRVPLDARVVLSKRRAGYLRFIGKLAGEAGEWYGVALDEAKGDHDGRWQGVAYFHCPHGHGVFVRRKEIFYLKDQPSYVKNPPSPVMNDTSDEGDAPTANGSSDSGVSLDSQDALAVTASPQRLFKSFHQRVPQTPTKLGQSLLSGTASLVATVSPGKSPSRRTPTRASMIPPPAIATVGKHTASRHQSIAILTPLPPPVVAPSSPAKAESSSLFDEADAFASMTHALSLDQNNASPPPPSPSSLELPPHIDTQSQPGDGLETSSRETSPVSSPQRRPTTERRHSTFAFGSPLAVSSTSAAASATANAVRVLELEKEIGTMRTNHENVVAVLRATNKQHAANVLELRAQVSALADGNSYLQRQLSLKSTQLHELKQNERQSEQDRSELQTKLQERHTKILQLEEEMTALQAQMKRSGGEKESVLVHMQREFQARQRRDREQIKALRDEVVALVNARNALRAELQDAKETSFFFF